MIKQFEIGPMKNFSYLIGDESTKKAFVVDPAWDPDGIVKNLRAGGFTLAGLLVTHAHYDHTNAILDLLKIHDVPVYANKHEVAYAASGASIVGDLGRTVKPVEGGDKIKLGETEIEFLHTPGHTPGSQCFLVNDRLVSGDTLFIDSCGRVDLPGGNPEEMYASLTQRLMALPDETLLFPGHNYARAKSSTLGDQRKSNPYLQFQSLSQFLRAMGYA